MSSNPESEPGYDQPGYDQEFQPQQEIQPNNEDVNKADHEKRTKALSVKAWRLGYTGLALAMITGAVGAAQKAAKRNELMEQGKDIFSHSHRIPDSLGFDMEFDSYQMGHSMPEKYAELADSLKNKVGTGEVWLSEYNASLSENKKVVLRRDTLARTGEYKKIELGPFDHSGLDSAGIRRVIDQTVPKFFSENVSRIRFADTVRTFSQTDDANEKIIEAGHLGDREIILSAKHLEDRLDFAVNSMLMHELAHGQDWEKNILLTVEERLDLLNAVVKRLSAKDRHISSYVDGYQYKDLKKQLMTQAKEYFAVIFAAYLSPEGYKSLPQADRVIIHDLVKKLDPSFNREEATAKRLQIYNAPQIFVQTPPGSSEINL